MNAALVKKINLFTLLACIALTVVLCPKKQMYFDEPFQIMEAHGFSIPTAEKYYSQPTFTAAEMDKENTLHNVFSYSDSIHYVLIHLLNPIFGNGLNFYVYFSLFWAICTLIAFYFLCRRVIGDNLFTALALVLLFTNISFLAQAYSIRHYIMALFFATMSGIYFFKYRDEKSVMSLLMLGLTCAVCIVSHYFTFYIILIYIAAILLEERLGFFKLKNILVLLIPLAMLAVYFHFHVSPIQDNHTYQNYIKHQPLAINADMSLGNEFSLFLKSVSVNFMVFYPLFKDIFIVRIGSVLLLLAVYVFGVMKLFPDKEERRKFHLVFALGIISCFVLVALAVRGKNNMLFSYRYFLFSMPFCCLFVALFLKQLLRNAHTNVAVKGLIVVVLIGPGLFKFVAMRMKRAANNGLECNQLVVVDEIKKNNVHKLEVPEVVDAIFINSLLPANYEMTYTTNANTDTATLYYNNTTEKIHLAKNSLVVLF